MKTIYNVKTLCVVAMIAIAGTIQAQDDNLKREMTLEREYDPSVQDANKVNTLPVVKQPEIKKTAIDYATQTVPTDPEKEISVLPSGKIMTDIVYNKNRGYFNVGAGMYTNINGDLGYHILNTDKDQLNIFLSHRSSGGKRKYLQVDDVKQKVNFNDNLGGINFLHNFDKASMKLGARYGYNSFNYFGYPVGVSDITIPINVNRDTETKQVNQQISINAGVESKEGATLGYLLDFDFTNFSHKYGLSKDFDGIKENTIGVKAGLNAPFGGNQLIGVLGKLEYLSYNIPNVTPEPEFENHAEVTLSPYYKVEGDIWQVKLGANVMIITGENDKIFASPNISADVKVADKTVLYLNADGKIQSNSAFELSKRNRYINPWFDVLPSRTWLDGIVGVKSGVAPGFWFDVFTGYKATDNDCFFYQTGMANGFGNFSNTMRLNSKLFFVGAKLKYSYQDIFDFSLKGVLNNWDVKEAEGWTAEGIEFEAYGRPKTEITSTIDIRPIDKLTISAKYYLASGRYTVHPLSSYIAEKMDNINELNVTALYNITSKVGVYGQLNNLLFQKYDLLYGYPAQGFNAMVGVNINF